MEEKKVKFEISKLTLAFIILFSLSLLIWSFVAGVWVGTKISTEETKEIVLEKETIPEKQPPTLSQPQETVIIEKEKPTPKKVEKEIEKPQVKYKKKEVAKIASEIKKEPKVFYSLQIGAFSKKESAEKLKNLAISKGYESFIKSFKSNGKILYKVYVGKYSTQAEAKKHIFEIAKNLNVKNPFPVKIK